MVLYGVKADNSDGQCGLGHTNEVKEPTKIDYFIKNDIKIINMDCGCEHALMVDCDGGLWIFGGNDYGQLRVPSIKRSWRDTTIPQQIMEFKDYQIEMIKCGISHNYVKCRNGDEDMHYLWGSNVVKNV